MNESSHMAVKSILECGLYSGSTLFSGEPRIPVIEDLNVCPPGWNLLLFFWRHKHGSDEKSGA